VVVVVLSAESVDALVAGGAGGDGIVRDGSLDRRTAAVTIIENCA
jgi:hypothetical protein